ncbi:MAG TPA: hypothetical protein VH592_01140 [Gemmataceae bacterium]
MLKAQKNLQQANANLAFAKKGNEILGSVFTGLDPRKNYGTMGEFSQALKNNLRKAVQELEGSAVLRRSVCAHRKKCLREMAKRFSKS